MKLYFEQNKQKVYQQAVVVLCLFFFVTTAWADETGTTDIENPQEIQARNDLTSSAQIETITVTARKKEESVQKVPMSLSVFSGQMIEEAGVNTTSELLRYSPNVYVRDAGVNHQTIIRGINAFETALHSATGYYIDDVNIPLVYMQNPDLLDVERVEVLKGPQGTLYGRNSEAGVINIVTRQPGNETQGKVFAGYNFYDTEHGNGPGYQAGATLSTPIATDKFYIGLAGKFENSDGFIENEYNADNQSDEERRFNGHVNFRWTPTRAWDNSLTIDMMDSSGGFYSGRLNETIGRQLVSNDAPYYRDQTGNTQTLRLKYQGESFDFLSVSGRNFYDDDWAADYDLSSLDLYTSTQKEEDTYLSQEFRISSPADSRGALSWLVGTYFFKEDINTYCYLLDTRETDIDMKGTAIFGQATYTFVDRLHFTMGARYDYQKMEGTQVYTQYSGATSSYSNDDSRGKFLPKASLSYDLTETAMVYTTVAKGYMSGGFSYGMATDSESLMYGPEYTWNYEAGLKTSWFDNRLIANLAAFYIDMEDKQVSEVSATTLTTKVLNAAEAKAMGFELELEARPARGWRIYGNLGYTDTEIEKWDQSLDAQQQDYEGHELPNAPGLTYNIGTQYMHRTGIYARVDLLGMGSFFHDSQNTLEESAYEIVNLRLGYMMKNFEIALWCNNLFDTDYKRVQFNFGGMSGVFDGIPRQVGTTITYKF
jgi:iron complex outermembrane receptor protein